MHLFPFFLFLLFIFPAYFLFSPHPTPSPVEGGCQSEKYTPLLLVGDVGDLSHLHPGPGTRADPTRTTGRDERKLVFSRCRRG